MGFEVLKTIPISGDGRLRGFANIKVDSDLGPIELNGFRIVEGNDGLFVGMPQREYEDRQTGELKYTNTVWVGDRDAFNDLTAAILEAFGEEGQDRIRRGAGPPQQRAQGSGRRGDPNDRHYSQGGRQGAQGGQRPQGGGGGGPRRGERYTQPAPARSRQRQALPDDYGDLEDPLAQQGEVDDNDPRTW